MKSVRRCGFNSKLLLVLFIVLSLCVISGCSIKLVSDYDEKTDIGISNLQKKFDAFFLNLEETKSSPACSYQANKAFYTDSKVEINSLQIRAQAIPNNKITIQQLASLSEAFSKFQELHKIKDKAGACLTKEEIEPGRTAFNSIFTSILRFEIAKKRGN